MTLSVKRAGVLKAQSTLKRVKTEVAEAEEEQDVEVLPKKAAKQNDDEALRSNLMCPICQSVFYNPGKRLIDFFFLCFR